MKDAAIGLRSHATGAIPVVQRVVEKLRANARQEIRHLHTTGEYAVQNLVNLC